MKKTYTTLACLLLACTFSFAQSSGPLTLEQCRHLAMGNYPLAKRYAIIEKTEEHSLANASKGILPRFQVGGQASYQSDVAQIPVALPDMAIPTLDRAQYRLYGEIAQPITDLFTVRHQMELIEVETLGERQKITVEIHKVQERVNQLYFGILLLDAQLAQTDILKKDILAGIDRNRTAIENGTAPKSSADLLKAEFLKTDQRTVELKAMRKGLAGMLSLFIGQPIDEGTLLEKPPRITPGTEINRTELKLFEAQKKIFEVRKKRLNDSTLPRLSVFLQGGYGRPGLNLLRNDFAAYYVGGLRLTWNIAPFYTRKQDRHLLRLGQDALDAQRETFLFNTNLAVKQQDSEIAKLEELLRTDEAIVRLRENVKRSAQNQLENGTITANDYQTHVHAEDLARQNLALHEIQLLMALYDGQLTVGY